MSYCALRRRHQSPAIPMPSKAKLPGSGATTETESSFKKPGSSRKLKDSVVVGVLASAEKLSTWNACAGSFVLLKRVIAGAPAQMAEKSLGVAPSLA